MSKKDRLRAQKAKQEKQRKDDELSEQREKEEYESGAKKSKAAAKMRKNSGIKDERFYYLILKLLMLAAYGYSAFFYGLITIIGIAGDYIEPAPPKWVFWAFVCSCVGMTVGLFLTFFKKYYIAFVINTASVITYLSGGSYLITKIQEYLRTHYVEAGLADMDKDYMLRYYPAAVIAVISFVLLVITIIRTLLIRKRKQFIKDSAPVKSIVDD